MSTQSAASDGARSLADHLRRWDESALAALLHVRPDLATPAPQDSAQLASRVSTRASAARALDGLTHFELAIVGAVTTAQPVPRSDLVGRGPAVAAAVATLEERALVWPSPEGLRVASGVAEALGPGGFPTSTSPEPPELPTTPRDQAIIDRAAAGAAFDVVRRTELVLETWGHRPVTALRSGGLGVRDLRSLAATLLVTPTQAALLAELAVGAGLAATAANEDGDPAWMPTDAFDRWLEEDAAGRWLVLARTWLGLSRAPALVGERDHQDKPINALSPELASAGIAETRSMTLACLAEIGPGRTLAAGTGLPALLAHLAWRRPRRGAERDRQAAWTTSEAAELGLTGLDGVASWARLLLAGDAAGASSALAQALPAPVDHVVIQADLTAVAPGPLASALARDLGLLADVESGGGATVYRFSPASVRRGLDAGWSAAEIHAFLATVSVTPVPQPLAYLVDDCARTFGTVRVGHAETFLRADDEEALLALVHHPQADRLGLRLIAPTVLISATPLDVLLPRLREWGVAPVVEALDGTVHVARPDQHRARQPRERHRTAAVAREAARIPGIVAAIRAGDAAAAARPRGDGPLSPADALVALRTAIERGQTVVLTYVDNHGTLTDRPVRPRALLDGTLRALDERSGEDRAFAVHRIRDVRAPQT